MIRIGPKPLDFPAQAHFRKTHRIPQSKAPRSEDVLTMNQAVEYLRISHNGLLGLVRRGVVDTNQVTDFAPWQVDRRQLDSDEVQTMVKVLKTTGRLPKGGSPDLQPGLFDANNGLTSKVQRRATRFRVVTAWRGAGRGCCCGSPASTSCGAQTGSTTSSRASYHHG